MSDWATNIKEIDKILFNPKRLLIMSLLIAVGPITQGEIQKKCQFSWGAITAHINQLEKANYIKQGHQLTLKGPRVQVLVTEKGIEAYRDTLQKLKKFVGDIEEKKLILII